ncbi:MAG TPA: response regulator transcription factor [Bacteroidales bacterium]
MKQENEIIHVAIVEDDNEIRPLLEMIIDRSPGFSCKDTFSDCEQATAYIRNNPPNVVLMDVELPGMSGIEGIRQLKEHLPDTDFIMLTIRDDDETVLQALAAGATGYLLKDTPPAKLLDGIREVFEGGAPMSPTVARKIAASFYNTEPSPLSERETEILEKLCDGHNYTTIADTLYISGHTVRVHIKNIYRKLQVNSRAEAVKKAIQGKLI